MFKKNLTQPINIAQVYDSVFESVIAVKYCFLKIQQNNFFIFKKLFLSLTYQNDMKNKKIINLK